MPLRIDGDPWVTAPRPLGRYHSSAAPYDRRRTLLLLTAERDSLSTLNLVVPAAASHGDNSTQTKDDITRCDRLPNNGGTLDSQRG